MQKIISHTTATLKYDDVCKNSDPSSMFVAAIIPIKSISNSLCVIKMQTISAS
jgi:hypothetical protein